MKKRIIIWIILFFLLGGAAGLLYLNNVFLPTQVRMRVISALAEGSNYDADISGIHFNPFKGLVVKDIYL